MRISTHHHLRIVDLQRFFEGLGVSKVVSFFFFDVHPYLREDRGRQAVSPIFFRCVAKNHQLRLDPSQDELNSQLVADGQTILDDLSPPVPA